MASKVGKEYFKVVDPPSTLDSHLSDVAKFLSANLRDDDNFHRFGEQLVSAKKLDVTLIKQMTVQLKDKCLKLIELWIISVTGPKWQDLVDAANKADLHGLATALKEELDSPRDSPMDSRKEQSVDETDGGQPAEKPKANECQPAEKPKIDEVTLKARYKTEIKPKIVEKEQLADLNANEILIQTVNEKEFYAAMVRMNQECGISKYSVTNSSVCPGESFYYVGKWGEKKIPVVIVQTTMGSNGNHGSYNETKKALICLPNLKFIFAVGVCGGFIGKVKLGEVVVSKDLQDCSEKKIANDKIQIRSRSWQLKDDAFFHFLSQAANTLDNTASGTILSANNLVADAKFQKQLLDACPGAIALEMEGHGIARACQEYIDEKGRKIQFLVVKGVSDLADEQKSDDWQPQAASNAVNALYEVMADFKFGH